MRKNKKTENLEYVVSDFIIAGMLYARFFCTKNIKANIRKMYCFTDIYSNVSDDKKPRIACAIIDGRETAVNFSYVFAAKAPMLASGMKAAFFIKSIFFCKNPAY